MFLTVLICACLSFAIAFVGKKEAYDHRTQQFKLRIKIGYVIVWLTMVILAVYRPVGFGYGGADALGYIKYFEELNLSSLHDYLSIKSISELLNRREPLYFLLNYLIRLFTNDYHVLFFVIYGFIAYVYLRVVNDFYKRDSSFVTTFIVLSSYIYSFNIVRGGISVGFCMLSIFPLLKKEYSKSVLYCFLGVLFHYVAICFLGVILLRLLADRSPKLFSRLKLFVIVLMVNVACILGAATISAFFGNTKYAVYFRNTVSYSFFGHIPAIVVCIIAIVIQKKVYEDREFSTINIALAVQLSLMYATIYLGAWRVSDYFSLISMVFFSKAISSSRIISKRNALFFRTMIYVLFFVTLFQAYKSLYESSYVFPFFV